MAIAIALGEVALQIFLLLLTFQGWGYALAAGRLIPAPRGRFVWIVHLTAGLSAFTLFLLALLYAQVPLRYSAWLALLVGLMGWGLRWKMPSRCRAPRWFRDDSLAAALFLIVFLLQSVPILKLGPGTYYGIGKIDQLNYTVLCQFLIENSIDHPAVPSQTEPWQQLTVPTRQERLGVFMSLGYPAVLLHCDTHRLFGTVATFFLALLSASAFITLRRFSVSTLLAWAGAFWLGLTHAITLNSPTAYLSSQSVLFVAPLLVGLLWHNRQNPEALRLLPALLLAYTLCSYSELFPFIALVVLLQFLLLAKGRKLRFGKLTAITLVITTVLSLPYLPRLLDFLHRQLGNAFKIPASMNPKWGHWQGWSELFVADIQSARFPWINELMMWLAIGLIPVTLFGLFSSTKFRNRYLILLAVGTSCWPLLLLVTVPFRAYIFFKLCLTFLPVFLILIVVGFQQLGRFSARRSPVLRMGVVAYLALMIGSSLLSSLIVWRTVIGMAGQLPCNAPAALATYNYVREHPEETYYLTTPDRYLACWIAYHARHSKVYTRQEVIFPNWLTSEENLQPPPPPPYTILDGEQPPRPIPPL